MQKDRFYSFIATGFYIGKIPFMPGTCGSLLAALLWIVINYFAFAVCLNTDNPISYAYFVIAIWVLIIIATFFIGIKSATYYCRKHRKDDAGEVVIDEFCGQWLALFISCLGSGTFGLAMTRFSWAYFIAIISSFVLFRIFDIWKPWLIGRVDKNIKGGLGVMLDDVIAGIFVGLVFIILKTVIGIWF